MIFCRPDMTRYAKQGERVIFIHIFGGFRKLPKIGAFFQINRTG